MGKSINCSPIQYIMEGTLLTYSDDSLHEVLTCGQHLWKSKVRLFSILN